MARRKDLHFLRKTQPTKNILTMKKFLLVAALFMSSVISAQVLTVGSLQKLPVAGQDNRVAAFSPCGSYLLLTARNQQGLRKFDLSTASLTPLTQAPAAGVCARVSSDGKSISWRENVSVGGRQIGARYMSRNLQTSQTRQLSVAEAMASATVGISQDLKLQVTLGGNTYTLAPQGNQYSYIWATLSPDGTKISYYCSEIGGFVCDLEGNVLCSVGDQVHAAKWYDNETLVGMDYHSDGQRTTASAITAFALDGRFQRLTSSSVIALYPQVSAGKIAFSTPEGEVYLLNVKK